MIHKRYPFIRRTLIVAGLLCAGLASAAGFPERPVTLVAPYPAGGAADVLSRILAKKLEEQLGQPVVVENKPGAGTATRATFVSDAKPDGYTLLLRSNSTFSLNPVLQSTLSYDAVKGFDAIGMVGSVALAVLVHPAVAAANMPQLVAAVKASPDTQDRMKAAGFEASYSPVADWAGFVGADVARMRKIAEQSNTKAD